jgi:hypothetical protein
VSIYPRDYIDTYVEQNRDWLFDDMVEVIRADELDDAQSVIDNVLGFHGVDNAVEEIVDSITQDLRWELEDDVNSIISDLADEALQHVLDNPVDPEED